MEEIGRCWVHGVEGMGQCVCVAVWKAERGVADGGWMPPPSRPWNQKSLPTRQPPAHPPSFTVCVCVCGRGPLGNVQSCKVSPSSSSSYLLSPRPVLPSPPPALCATSCHMRVCITALLLCSISLTEFSQPSLEICVLAICKLVTDERNGLRKSNKKMLFMINLMVENAACSDKNAVPQAERTVFPHLECTFKD